MNALPGLLLAALVAAAALYGSPRAGLPDVVLAIALGAVLGNLLPARVRKRLQPGLQVFTKKILKLAIVLAGLKLTADLAAKLGSHVFAIIASCLCLAMVLGAVLGRAFGVSRRVALLLGCGTAICGATAVVTIAPIADADDDEVAFSIATIFLFNVVALFVFPVIGHHGGLTDLQFGTWAGTSVNDTSAVIATGKAYSPAAETFATTIKLIRTLALVPMALGVAAFTARAREGGGKKVSVSAVFPWFVVGFAVLAAATNYGLPPALTRPLVSAGGRAWSVKDLCLLLSGWGIVGVLAAVGLNLDAKKIFGSGARSLALGFTLAAIMAVASFSLVHALL
ncbi:MAG TPA: putative sulfate exporter family transporter [Planctomycetota bacterium]|nr:putative sulfate exporter family transporter [Planctomycetota bacterium]